ncbi:uncharacterized protein LOC117295800 [Asterias rubens]|uniref:uncharacterized protein LOC117295800 n=1 Tax=Asterias rubens TaxID=7604 RepID=UPI001455A1E6|nr:uncharacterized protein LOC117295800 [Asterias rubens]
MAASTSFSTLLERIKSVNCKSVLLLWVLVLIVPCDKIQADIPSPICGSNLYDTETLKSASYWTITKPGICYDSWSETIPCTINLAFCQSLPPSLTRGIEGCGASQKEDLHLATYKILGQENQFTDDASGTQLIATYPNGDDLSCGTIGLVMYLKCNKSAVWAKPINGQPNAIPTEVTVELDSKPGGCLYSIHADYAGACKAEIPTYLSFGTVLIILFFCLLAAYLLVGFIYNMCAGATGRELIPNYEMWQRLPNDILLGVSFFVGCITCRDVKSSDTYESI